MRWRAEIYPRAKGIIYRDALGKIHKTENRPPIMDLDSIPFFRPRDYFPMDIYLKNPVGAPNRNKWINGSSQARDSLSLNIFATRGCLYKCIYCY